MADFPMPRVLDFVKSVTPFDTLPEPDLLNAVSKMEIEFFPAGAEIMIQGQPPPEHLYLIHSGSIKRVLKGSGSEAEVLVNILGEGDMFGGLAIMRGQVNLFTVLAREDLICYLLPAQEFTGLAERHPHFKSYFQGTLTQIIRASREQAADLRSRTAPGLDGVRFDPAMVQSTVGQLMNHKPLFCAPRTPVKAAAHRMSMRRVTSIVVVDEGTQPVGIVTDRDLRERVVAAGRPLDVSVAEVMSYPLATVGPDEPAFESLITMTRQGINHLAVTKDGRLVGVLSARDLQALTGDSPVTVIRDVEKCRSLEELVDLHTSMDRVLETLLRQGGSARTMLALVTEFNDRLTRRLLLIIEEEMENQGLGRAPVPYCWMALGSEGRREQSLRTDQDNALLYANLPQKREEKARKWFLEFASRMASGLEACGFPRCQGGIMAENPRWCQSETAWQQTFLNWVNEPNPETLRLASIFFDFRPIYSEADFLEKLAEVLARAVEANRLFLRNLAHNGLFNRPPLGLLGKIVVLKDGENKNKLNLKLRGLTPVVDAARVLSLDLDLRETNTLKRLEGAAKSGLIKPDLAEDLKEAFSFISVLRVTNHLEARAKGEVPDNYLDPKALGSLQRKMMKESFQVIAKLQELLEHRYQTRQLG